MQTDLMILTALVHSRLTLTMTKQILNLLVLVLLVQLVVHLPVLVPLLLPLLLLAPLPLLDRGLLLLVLVLHLVLLLAVD